MLRSSLSHRSPLSYRSLLLHRSPLSRRSSQFSSRFNVLTSKKISSIFTNGDGAVEHLEMSDGSLMLADKYVVAAGTSSRALLASAGVSCPTVAVKGYLMTFNSSSRIEHNLAMSNKTFVSPLKFDEDLGVYQYRASGFAEVRSGEERSNQRR